MAETEFVPYEGSYASADIDTAIAQAALVPSLQTAVEGKQDELTFDNTPTADSSNPVTSKGVYDALAGKQGELTTAQLAAANSGIDSTKVGQITTAASAAAVAVDGIEKNIISTNAETQTMNGIRYWNCGDGTWIVNGTATSRALCPLDFKVPATLPAGRYVLSGCPAGGVVGSSTKYALYFFDVTTNSRVTANNDDTGDGFAFDWTPDPSHTYRIYIDIRNGTTASNLVFKPMICTEAAWNASHGFVRHKAAKRAAVKVGIKSTNIISGGWVNAANGNISEGNLNYTDFIAVDGFTKVGVSCGFGQFAFYDNSKTYISGVTIAVTDTHDYAEYDIPNKAKYVRFTIGNSAAGNAFYTLNNGEQMFDPVIVSATKYGGQFRKLREGVEYATRFTDAKVVVLGGTYDLTSEFSTEITNATTAAEEFGITLKNGVHITFSSQAVVNAKYTGSNADVPKYFAPFRVEALGDDRFELEGLTINSQNTRYCVHDELNGKSTQFTRHIYRNCRMTHDSTTIPLTGNNYVACIGGGCGRQTYVEIDGCEFKSKRAESSLTPLVSYHNAINAAGETHDGKSAIYVRNSYFHDNGYTRCTYYGETTQVSKFVVSGCSLGSAPVVKYEVEGATTPENFELVAFNNEIRE